MRYKRIENMSDVIGESSSETRIFSEVKRGLIIGRKGSAAGKNTFFLMASFGENSSGLIINPQKMVAYSLLVAMIMAFSARFLLVRRK